MKTSSTLYLVIQLAMVSTPSAAAQAASTSLSLEDALRLFAGQSIELTLARSQLRAGLASARQRRAVSNPTASFSTEDLGQYSERYFNVTQRVDFLWQGSSRSRGATARESVARSTFLADSARVVLALKLTFLTAWERAQVVSALTDVDRVLEDVVSDAAERVSAGDLAGYDLRRLQVARAGIDHRLVRAELSLADAERRLGALVSGDGSLPRIRALPPSPSVPRLPPAAFGDAGAFERRPELAAAGSVTDALEADANLVRSARWEGVDLTGGFKQQSDGQDGLFLGVQLSIPVLNRRGGAVDEAEAEIDRSRSEFDLLRLSLAQEASLTRARLLAVSGQRERLQGRGLGEAEQLLTIARIAYDEGEVGIVELVDASDAFLGARLLEIGLRIEEWMAYFEYEHAIGGFAAETGAER